VHDVSDAGLFGPASVTWRVNREWALLLGGGRALLLQVAHPLVAAGVEQHSSYREDPWGRLYRTLDLTTRIVFGSTRVAEEAARKLWRVHGHVHGIAPGGRPYDARDPELLMWVHATLLDTALLVYQRYVARLTIAELCAYYEEQKLLGERYGIPRERMPASYGEFNDYFASMVEGETLQASHTLRTVADMTLRFGPLDLVTIGLLPARVRELLGLDWGPRRERLLGASQRATRSLLPLLPSLMRDLPPARRAA
jgi:uncharacterized protein (DUF2236 family)